MSYSKQKKRGFTLIEILVVIGLIAVLAAIVLIAINPARQFRQARDSQRVSNVSAILNAVGQYLADHKGVLPIGIKEVKQKISSGEANICSDLVPMYLPQLPSDPNATAVASPCPATYDSGYSVVKDAAGRVTVSADGEEPLGTDNIAITR